MSLPETLSGTIVDPVNRETFSGRLHLKDGRIAAVERTDDVDPGFLMPGFVVTELTDDVTVALAVSGLVQVYALDARLIAQ